MNVELLDPRILPAVGDSIANAVSLSFLDSSNFLQTAHATEFIQVANDVQINRIELETNDVVSIETDTDPYGGGLNNFLRVFQELAGGGVREIASNDNLHGRDAGLTFQAATAGTYYVGISSFDNADYDPETAQSGTGTSQGLFDLKVTKTTAVASSRGIVSTLNVSQSLAVWGDSITVNFVIENRGSIATLEDLVSLQLTSDNRFTNEVVELEEAPLPALAPGEKHEGSFTVELGTPGTPPIGFLDAQSVFLGLQIGASAPSSPQLGNDWQSVQMLRSEDVVGVNTSFATAQAISLNSRTTLTAIGVGEAHFFEVDFFETGKLEAFLDATSSASLTLLDTQGQVIVQSHGRTHGGLDAAIDHHLVEGTYFLKVENLSGGPSTYTLTSLFTPSVSHLQNSSVSEASAVVTGDLNGDGITDLAVGTSSRTIAVLLGNGDGSFYRAGSFNAGTFVSTLYRGDFNNDGRTDLMAMNIGSGIGFLLGNGDGTFITSAQDASLFVDLVGGESAAMADFNGDGNQDVAFAARTSGFVSVLLGNGNATFEVAANFFVELGLTSIVAGDFGEDGHVDIAVVGLDSDQLYILQGDGNGEFQEVQQVAVGETPLDLAVADFDGDGHLDLAVANFTDDNVAIFTGNGTGTFFASGSFRVGTQPTELVTADFNSDGVVDLATLNSRSNDMTLSLGKGDGTFRSVNTFPLGAGPKSLQVGDFNGDGRVDTVNGNRRANDVSVMFGDASGGMFGLAPVNQSGNDALVLATGEFNGDGQVDLVVTNPTTNEVTVLLGQGDGNTRFGGTFAAGDFPSDLQVGDFNGDGRNDIISVNYDSADIAVLLGNGDGTFQPPIFSTVDDTPVALVIGDFNGDRRLDAAVVERFSARVQILFGDGRGKFTDGGGFDTGFSPVEIVAGDFDGDGNLDLATANNYYYYDQVTVVLGDGAGNFLNPISLTLNTWFPAIALVAGDFDGDLAIDLAVATEYYYYTDIAVLTNDGLGAFTHTSSAFLNQQIRNLVVGDFDGDGNRDLATTDFYTLYNYEYLNSVTILLGNGSGEFAMDNSFAVGDDPRDVVSTDLNADGRLDIVTVNLGSLDISSLLGTGTGEFFSPILAPNSIQSTPIVAELSGALDTLVLTQTGKILFRRGLPTQPGSFAPPVVLNPSVDDAARDLTIVKTIAGELVAALSANTLPEPNNPQSGAQLPRVMLFEFRNGAFDALAGFNLPADFIPASIASADLDGDGLGDLIITEAASDRVLIAFQTAPGVFAAPTSLNVGVNPVDISFALLNDDGLLDIVITNRFSGQLSVLINDDNRTFRNEQRFRAGTGLYALTEISNSLAVESLQGTSRLVVGQFDSDAGLDAVVLNSNTNSLSLLSGDETGGFLNPDDEHTFFTGETPIAIVAAHLIDGNVTLDLVVLGETNVMVYSGDGNGGFTEVFSASAGNLPSGLSVEDVTRPGGGGPDGFLDLLIGNAFGDLLVLAGDGLGSFGQYRRANDTVSLAVARTSVADQNSFFFSNQASDQLSNRVAPRGAATIAAPAVFQDRSVGIQAPGPQSVVTVDGTQYLIVLNSGSNSLFIYMLDEHGQPDPNSKQTFFTGTDPTSFTVTSIANDLNQDGVPDVVTVNHGSNDLSIFLGEMDGETWTLSSRPRQSSGGFGPTSVAIEDLVDGAGVNSPDGQPDLVVSNGDSNSVDIVSSLGDGFFLNAPNSFATGITPNQVLLGNFDGIAGNDLVTVNAGSNNITLISNLFTANQFTSSISSGGAIPIKAAIASLNDDGISDLLVANLGDGTLGVLFGSLGGFLSQASVGQTALPNLSDLALVTTGATLEVYGAGSGQDLAILLATFGPPPETIFVPQSPGFAQVTFVLTSSDFISRESTMVSEGTLYFLGIETSSQSDSEDGSQVGSFNLNSEAVGTIEENSGADSEGDNNGGRASDGDSSTPSRILLLNLEDPKTTSETGNANPPEEKIPKEEDEKELDDDMSFKDTQDLERQGQVIKPEPPDPDDECRISPTPKIIVWAASGLPEAASLSKTQFVTPRNAEWRHLLMAGTVSTYVHRGRDKQERSVGSSNMTAS